MNDNFPSQLLQALSLVSSTESSYQSSNHRFALEECNRAFEAASPSTLSTLPAPSNSLLHKVTHVLESMLLQDIPNDSDDTGSASGTGNSETLVYSEYLRAAKNLLRWNLIWQSLQPISAMSTPAPTPAAVSGLDDDNQDEGGSGENLNSNNGNPFEALQRFSMLSLYMSHLNASIGIPSRQEEARYATLCLLHATYHNTIDTSNKEQQEEQQQSPLEYLVQDLSYLQIFCKVMLNVASTRAVQLANLRLLHNLMVSLPSFVKDLHQCKLSDAYDEDNKNAVVPLTNINTVQDLLLYHVDVCTSVEDGGGDDNDDRHQEVVTELTRILYILRAGRTMDAQLLKRLLLLPESRLLAIMLLTDTPTAAVIEMDVKSILMDAFEAQVSAVVDQTLLGTEATSALTPVLMLFNNVCQNHIEFRQATRSRIFPNPIDSSSAAGNPNDTRMTPADAPPGTLRNRCIRLLSWTESHTKRWMAELLWIVCDGNAEEYVQRVGLGNAMPLLNARGLMELPTTDQS
ncbi:hypothetical protein MHU86_13468 [Fragilaria crotonensis]|nr:hypothetical protein MHU86_13468 [Fragilaria crotonensis]